MLYLTKGCTVEESGQWTYTVSHDVPALNIEIEDQYMLPAFNVTFEVPKQENISAISKLTTDELKDLKEFTYNKLPKISDWKKVDFLTKRSNYLAWIAIGLIIILIIVFVR